MEIILDTNFLIYCAKEKLDYVEEIADLINEGYELVVPKQVVNELEKLHNDKWKKVSGKDKAAAGLAIELLEHNKIKVVDAHGKNVDESIVNLSKEDIKNIVCTLDRGMRYTLGRVILVSKGKKLMLTK
ncbi:MAG: PIN domain-containing protein [Nanoarchaeota archaeon]